MTEEAQTPEVPLAILIADMLDELDMTRRQFAMRSGLHPALLNLCLSRRCDFPLAQIPEIADAIGFRRETLMSIALSESLPGIISALVRSLVGFTDNEQQIVAFIRSISDRRDPALSDEGVHDRLIKTFGRQGREPGNSTQ